MPRWWWDQGGAALATALPVALSQVLEKMAEGALSSVDPLASFQVEGVAANWILMVLGEFLLLLPMWAVRGMTVEAVKGSHPIREGAHSKGPPSNFLRVQVSGEMAHSTLPTRAGWGMC